MLPEDISILARSTRAPFGNSPAFMRRNRSRFSSTERSRNGLFWPGFGQGAARDADFLLRLVVDIGVAGADQVFRPFVEPIEIIRGVKKIGSPVVAEPVHVGLNRIDIFLLFLGRIGVVEPQVAAPGKLLRDAEIERDRLGMADMQIAVRLRREPRHDLAVLLASRSAWMMSRMKSRPASAATGSAVIASSCSGSADLLPNPTRSQEGLSVRRL